MKKTQSFEDISTKVARIAKLAKHAPETALTTLAHHIDIEWLREAHRRTRKDGAKGVDGQSAVEYAANLEKNLQSLLDRAKSGTYRAPAVRRVYIPKGSGAETRPLGIPTFEDKVLQRAVTMVLEAIYEQDFLDCSYGFRPGRSAHQLLDALHAQVMMWQGGWVIELDIRKFFDSVDHAHLRRVLQKRVNDGVLLRLIGKWLNAGVMEDGALTYPDAGTPQGGVISPMLANVFLHEVLDAWFERDVLPRLSGHARLFRYADDAVILLTDEGDARRVLEVLTKRFAKHGLALHPEKTRLIDFRAPSRRTSQDGTHSVPTFDLLGFTHHWARSRVGRWVVFRRTAMDRFRRGLKRIAEWCRDHRHRAVRDQHRELSRKLQGHYAYFGIPGNANALWRMQYLARCAWLKWLDRRSWRAKLTWPKRNALAERFPFPAPRRAKPRRRSANP